jgi:diguanylate cyclase (GGDEF)-like protein
VTRKHRNVALIMMDVDRFKYFNDTLGDPAGDMLRREIADVLKLTCELAILPAVMAARSLQ